MADSATPSKCDPEQVELAVLEETIELHPQRLTVEELALRVVVDPNDDWEVETIADAIRDLRRSGLLRYRNDDRVVELTHTALRAAALLAGSLP